MTHMTTNHLHIKYVYIKKMNFSVFFFRNILFAHKQEDFIAFFLYLILGRPFLSTTERGRPLHKHGKVCTVLSKLEWRRRFIPCMCVPTSEGGVG